MEEKQNKKQIKIFVLFTKYLPVLIAVIHFINTTISFFHGNDIPLNYIGGISFVFISYLYIASYTFKLCEYHRMFIHYTVLCNVLNIFDYYIGIPLSDVNYYILQIIITITTMFVVVYLKFFKI